MRIASIALGVAVLALAGCGSNSDNSSELSSDQQLKVAHVRVAFASTVLDSSMYGKTLDGVDYLISLCRKGPDAIYQPGGTGETLTMRQVVEDGANTLRQYQPDLAAKLQTVADNGCK